MKRFVSFVGFFALPLVVNACLSPSPSPKVIDHIAQLIRSVILVFPLVILLIFVKFADMIMYHRRVMLAMEGKSVFARIFIRALALWRCPH